MMQYLNDPTQHVISREEIVGLDNLISHDVNEKIDEVKATRANHAAAVLEEQARQQRLGVDLPQELVRISALSSKSEMTRVLKVGKLHALIANDTEL